MAKSKKEGLRAAPNGNDDYRDQGPRDTFVPPARENHKNRSGIGKPQAKYTLRNEATDTEHRHHTWSTDSKFRHTPVSFLSAGELVAKRLMEGETQDGHVEEDQFGSSSDDLDVPRRAMAVVSIGQSETAVSSGNLAGNTSDGHRPEPEYVSQGFQVPGSGPQGERPLFVVDVEGFKSPVNTGLPSPKLPPPSPTCSHSSAEIIVFPGRNASTEGKSEGHPLTPSPAPSVRSRPPRSVALGSEVESDRALYMSDGNRKSSHLEGSNIQLKVRVIEDSPLKYLNTIRSEAAMQSEASDQTRNDSAKVKHRRDVGRGKKQKPKPKESEDALFADYIANMQEHDDADHVYRQGTYNNRVLGGSELGSDEERRFRGQKNSAPSKGIREDGWDSSEIQDFDNLDTSDDDPASVKQVLAKRTRPNGLQYLVVKVGQTTDDARWVRSSSLTTTGAIEKIRLFKRQETEKVSRRKSNKRIDSPDPEWQPETEDSESSDEESYNEEDIIKDNEDLIKRKIARMTDEKIARLLSKQEELGMGSNELLLLDDDDLDEDGYEADDNDLLGQNQNDPSSMVANRLRSSPRFPKNGRLSKRARHDGDINIMDWDQPGSRRKAKGSKVSLPFQVSDPDLEATLQEAWSKDRYRKSKKKQEREELRAQGLLGSKNKFKASLSVKYNEGMSLANIKDEVKIFLQSSKQSLPLPPMNKRDRRIVHEIANAVGLNSKSIGVGDSRFPVLHKTVRSRMYEENAMEAVEARLSQRRFFSRKDKAGKRKAKSGAAKRNGSGGGGGGFRSATAATYRDGDVVGAAAPELGVDNRGRAMLEKMGWSTGTALGALDNKGILQPVEHIVKTSKAGLG